MFDDKNPIPPDEITRQQMEAEDRILAAGTWGDNAKITAQNKEMIRTEAFTRMHYPEEAFSEDVLFWTYVVNEKQAYQKLLDAGDAADSPSVRDFLHHLRVATNYVMDPVPDEKVQSVNAWKIAYLQRLQRQNTDSSYIDAYLKAWKIPATELSAGKSLK